MVKVVLHNTHGDTYYIGLNGIAIHDVYGHQIAIQVDQIQAIPFRHYLNYNNTCEILIIITLEM
jgi:hypothetical protein